MRSRWFAVCAAFAATGAFAACTSSTHRSGATSVHPTGGASISASVSGSAQASAPALAAGHCSLYTRSDATALIGKPNLTAGLPPISASGGTSLDTCMYSNVNIGSRSAKMLGYGAVKYPNNAAAAAKAKSALAKAESAAMNKPQEFPAPDLPAGTRDSVWKTAAPSGIPSVTVAATVSNVGRYLVWAEGGGTVNTQQAERIARTVAKAVVDKAGG